MIAYLSKHNNCKTRGKRKVLLYWNGAAARRDKKKRNEKIEKAENSLNNNAYFINHGHTKYHKEENVVSETGEVADKKIIKIDYEKIKTEEMYDGYFAIVTSELDFDEKKIREVYHSLWRIEDSFRITKGDLLARPIFVRTKKHIEGHFLICYIALVIIRILQYKMNYSLSVERIVRALHMCSCSELTKGTIHVIKKDTFEKYKIKKDKNGNEYYSLNLSEIENETVNDFKEILKYYSTKLCTSIMNKSQFDKYISTIIFK